MRNDDLQLDEATFDRLVDGELSAEERRRLLVSLDDRPGGWRACALAFLEAQAWRGKMRSLSTETLTPTRIEAKSEQAITVTPNRSIAQSAGRWFALAASALVAFGLGSLWSSDRAASTVATSETPPAIVQLADDDMTGPEIMSPALSTTPSPSTTTRDSLTLWVRDHTGAPQRLHVPLVDASTVDRNLGVQFRSAMPDSLRAEFRASGYDVHSTRRYAPLVLEDGGSLVVPVEDTRIVPISPEVY